MCIRDSLDFDLRVLFTDFAHSLDEVAVRQLYDVGFCYDGHVLLAVLSGEFKGCTGEMCIRDSLGAALRNRLKRRGLYQRFTDRDLRHRRGAGRSQTKHDHRGQGGWSPVL